MKKTSLLFIMGVLTFSLALTAFVTASADSASETTAAQGTVVPLLTPTIEVPPPINEPLIETPTATAIAPFAPAVDSSLVTLWDKICVRKVPYTILAIPASASFDLLAPDGSIIPALEPNATPVPGANRCESVLNLGGRQVLVCSGQQNSVFMLRVTDGSLTEDFEVPLKACPLKPLQLEETETPAPTPTMIETPSVPFS